MSMQRRNFLGMIGGALAAAVAGATLDPDRALWIPGQKVYSIPAVVGVRVRRWVVTDRWEIGSPQWPRLEALHEKTIEVLLRMDRKLTVDKVNGRQMVAYSVWSDE